MLWCVSDAKAAFNHRSASDDFTDLSATWIMAQDRKQVFSGRGTLVAERPTATVNTMELAAAVT